MLRKLSLLVAIMAAISVPAFAQQPNQDQEIAKVSQVLARYVRAADRRDSEAVERLFVENGAVEMRWFNSGAPQPIGRLEGRKKIAWAVANMIPPHTQRGNSHHSSMDHIVTINGDRAELDAQFVLYRTVSAARPETGWPPGTSGNQGTIRADNAGYYRLKLVRVDGDWRIAEMIIDHDLPFVPARR
ncbi:MAG: nuclear transport factor 2 family protein [Rhodocyclales bacterium]|nr:nuclear transport factor 2 family protein [Rhodocyclales bacterium]